MAASALSPAASAAKPLTDSTSSLPLQAPAPVTRVLSADKDKLSLLQLQSTDNQPQNQNVLNVFFSAPLAWRDRSNRLHPLDALDYTSERDALAQVFREVQRDISVCFDFATTDSIRTALSFGCRALHFSGHGHPQCLNFGE
jgi:hypothetical protein